MTLNVENLILLTNVENIMNKHIRAEVLKRIGTKELIITIIMSELNFGDI